ncbi:lung seven transmembrane receptor [Anaeramoeba flamelloides]|uniref:Lung seven transmembrane receptor n=1 Tax=Anaeramoeba flamelloides TaxID=1746091 RepID=A0AAV7ZFJ8_9EUKA|nr:lung seven transmembrane receptor [Anaeramoeba flamelloides]
MLRWNLFFFFILFFTTTTTNCLEITLDNEINNYLNKLSNEFYFAKGGTIEIDIQSNTDQELYFVVGDIEEYETQNTYQVKNETQFIARICRASNTFRYEFSKTLQTTITINEEKQYYTSILNCENTQDLQVKGKLKMLNPPNLQLPLDQHHLIPTYIVLAIVYLLLFVFWFLLMCKKRNLLTILQYLLLFTLNLKFFQAVLTIVLYSNTYYTGNWNRIIESCKIGVEIVAESFFYVSLFLIATGYKTIRENFSMKERYIYYFIWVVLVINGANSKVCAMKYGDQNQQCEAWDLIDLGIKLLLNVLNVFLTVVQTEKLRKRVFSSTFFRNKIKMFYQFQTYSTFRKFYVFFFLFPILLLLVQNIILSKKRKWLSYSTDEIFVITILIYELYCYRPMLTNSFLYLNQFKQENLRIENLNNKEDSDDRLELEQYHGMSLSNISENSEQDSQQNQNFEPDQTSEEDEF